eukprot:gnl/TRDRNA2_/TRDRNA2_173177_c0_seq2.p1 gnl/TRDRNA2_/TRDRNA2_173177_c0~~gnl/TRDRNA2_/TRDRNA2_173177_c0_seq2.p1  ORF type:complete len:351 (+),score=13.57 gnl/TRDRNA2_/TRDRNA2_173177_c0_seq2:45-1097(+)
MYSPTILHSFCMFKSGQHKAILKYLGIVLCVPTICVALNHLFALHDGSCDRSRQLSPDSPTVVAVNGSLSARRDTISKECLHRSRSINGRLHGPIFNLHITHHAGRAFQKIAKSNGRKVNWNMSFTGVSTADPDGTWTDLESHFGYDDEIGSSLDLLGCSGSDTVLATVIRHPINRIFSRESPPRFEEGQDGCETDNYALRWYLGLMCRGPCCGGGFTGADKCMPLGKEHLELAKQRVSKFDVIFVLEHIHETSKLLCSRLGFEDCDIQQLHSSAISDVDAISRFTRRNALDIELYEFMKQRSFDMLLANGLPIPSAEAQAAALNFTSGNPSVTLDVRHQRSSTVRWKCR